MQMEVNGIAYQIGKMNVFTQLHVSRRLAPAFIEAKVSDKPELLVIAEAIAKMNDDDMNFIVNSCLAVCQRKEGEGWQKVQSAPGTIQYQDIQLDNVIKLCVETIKDNLGSFFNDL